jgi:glycosyltransferase involved in cell wall biosynthesis
MKTLREAKGLTAWISYKFWSFVFGLSHGAIPLTHGVTRDLVKAVPKLGDRAKTVHNVGFEKVTDFQPKGSKKSDSEFTVAACGRLVDVKDYPTLLKAIALLSKTQKVRLGVIGDGPLKSDLNELASSLGIGELVRFHGFIDEPAKVMQAADIFVLSSVSEGFGNVIVEAMSLGIPVVATDCPYGPGEIITNSDNGLLVPVQNPVAMAQAIEQLILDEPLRHSTAKNGHARAADFLPDRIGTDFANALGELIQLHSEQK